MTPEQIAKGLTKAQRAAIRGASAPLFGDGYMLLGRFETWRAFPGLHKKHLTDSPSHPVKLTPLGLSVRAYLMENQ